MPGHRRRLVATGSPSRPLVRRAVGALALLLAAILLPGCTTALRGAAAEEAPRTWGSLSAAREAAQDESPEPGDATSLAKETQNPVANLISVPFQYNTSYNDGPERKTQYVLNIQPVIPVHLNDDWNLITRTIVPLISQPAVERGDSRTHGIGDTTLSLFFSPKAPTEEGIIWGVGPVFQLPTNSNSNVLGNDKWAAGPAAVALTMKGPWVFGCLAQQLWSFAGTDKSEDISASLIQPFINYNFEGGTYLTSAPILTADWEADHGGDVWTVPVGGGVGHVFHVGKLPMNVQFQSFYNVHHPDDGPNWSTRLQLQFLFP